MTPKEFYEAQMNSPLTDDIVARIKHDVEVASTAYDMGLSDGLSRAYRACSAHLLETAKLCEAGLPPSAETLRILAAIFDAEGFRLEQKDDIS